MKLQEVIEQLEDLKGHCKENVEDGHDKYDIWNRDVLALDVAIDLLREMVE